ncbi:hypothetical protein ANO14919_078160 [Xylariales sp. No.14919]|nr:hypothetical protein ANO14919_078160 [Xylariales sp. No.14919]
MEGPKPSEALGGKLPEGGMSMKDLWADAAKSFESICGKSLQGGDVRSFDDVKARIENSSKPGGDDGPGDKWAKAKSVGLESLKYLKLLVGAASQASEFIPLPGSAVNITTNALCFVFDIPETIKGYNDAIDQVFGEVSSALSQFKIFESMDSVDPLLIKQIHLVMISFVKLCAYVVKYHQGRKRDRIFQQFKSVLNDDSGLAAGMAEFKQALQKQSDVEGTITLSVVVETRTDIKTVLENMSVSSKTNEETHQMVRSLNVDAKRDKALITIRDTLSAWSTVRLDTRTTQTCSDYHRSCLADTGSWIWKHSEYKAWTESKDIDTSHVLLISGPPSSGKTLVSSLITRNLEELRGRTYVAHYFFPSSTKKSDEKNPVQVALKYMAFQIARVDPTVRTALGKACDANPSAFRSSVNLENLWGELKIGTPGSGARYYLIFDGLENLPKAQAQMLLKFLLDRKVAADLAGTVRFLVSGTDNEFADESSVGSALRIQMSEHNMADMRVIIEDALTTRGILKNAKPGSNQQNAKDKIIEKLPQNAKGSYSLLQFGLDEVIRLLSTRTAIEELDRMLDQSTSSHEVAIKKLQQSLTPDEVSELNELLKWVLFSRITLNLNDLEAAMFLSSGTESLASLEHIIKTKYAAVLKLEDKEVYGQDGIRDYLYKERDNLDRLSQSKERATISMTITINNVDQEICGHFLWDLAHKAIRDKFRFDFDAASNSLQSNKVTVAVDEFEAHRTIVKRAFEYLGAERRDQTASIGDYLVGWLPYHLNRILQLEEEEKGALMPDEQTEIGRNLFQLFKDEEYIRRHKATFEKTYWWASEMEDLQKWLTDSAVVRKLDKRWRDRVRLAPNSIRGFLTELVKMIITGFLRERSWNVENAYWWVYEFMKVDNKTQNPSTLPDASVDDDDASSSSSPPSSNPEINWDLLSTWCQGFLQLPDSELNSLWYERLATAAAYHESPPDTVMSLFKRALEKGTPSWRCQRGLGEAYFSQGQTPEAITHIELALTDVQRDGASPKPEEKDIVDLHLLLGKYAYAAKDVQKAADQYLLVCQSKDAEQARQGQLGHLKSRLKYTDVKGLREMLSGELAADGGENKLVGILQMVARDPENADIILKMFHLAKGDRDLLAKIVQAMEAATTTPADGRATEMSSDDRFAEDEHRGVLLYYRGVAAYTYKACAEGTEPISEALRLWRESRDQLSNVGGDNAFSVRSNATTALAKHYFQHMMDDHNLDHVDALSRLAGVDSEFSNDSPGYLCALYALHDKKERSREVFVRLMRQALQILLDDTPDNDGLGLWMIHRIMHHHMDFVNSAIALSLYSYQDVVTKELYFELDNIEDGEGIDKQQVLETVTRLAEETIREVKNQVPDFSQQSQRIKAAKAHISALVATSNPDGNLAADGGDGGTGEEPEGRSEGKPVSADLVTATALRLLHTRITALQEKATQEHPNERWCDGRDRDGNQCKNEGVEHEFYHCVYCVNRDLCEDCFQRLRDPETEGEVMMCSSKHRWFRIPPGAADLCIGPIAKIVVVPEVKALETDESILEICYPEGEGEKITVTAWLEQLAAEWGISLKEISEETAGQTSSESNDASKE